VGDGGVAGMASVADTALTGGDAPALAAVMQAVSVVQVSPVLANRI
jgi:hypothetical protein